MLKQLFTITVAGLLLVGCGENKQTGKQQMTQQWQDARAGVQYGLARQQYESGNLNNARQSVDQALLLNPLHVEAMILSARISIEQGHLELAEQTLTQAIETAPGEAEVDYLLGVIDQRWQRPERALEHYRAAVRKNPKELAYVLAEAETLVVLNRVNEALALLSGKVVYFENSATIRDAVGQLLVQQGHYPEAVEMLRRANSLAGTDQAIREHLALAMYYNRQWRESADLLARLVTDPQYAQRADLHIALGECYMELNRARDARNAFDTATVLEPAAAGGWIRLAKAAMALEDYRRTHLSLRKAMSLEPSNSEIHLLYGYLRLREERLADALTSFNRAYTLDRTDTVSLCMIGYVLEKMGRQAQAMNYYAQALQLKPNDELASRLMANIDLAE